MVSVKNGTDLMALVRRDGGVVVILRLGRTFTSEAWFVVSCPLATIHQDSSVDRKKKTKKQKIKKTKG